MTTTAARAVDSKAWRLPESAVDAYLALLDAVSRREPPCAADPRCWYADDPADVLTAVEACQRCHALHPCRSYADLAGERYGVWAGVDRTSRNRDPKETK